MEEYEQELDTNSLKISIDVFREHALEAEALTAQAVSANDAALIEVQNEKYKDFHRGFVVSPGLPQREFFRHVVFAPGRDTGYAPVTFPGKCASIYIKRCLGINNTNAVMGCRYNRGDRV
jgi:N-acetylated-alpha-linked acidic dipeptidase